MRASRREGMALVTGASAGIGLELATILAQNGWDLVLVSKNQDRLRAIAHQLATECRVQAHAVPADFADPEAPAAIFEATIANKWRIEVLVNIGGLSPGAPFVETDPKALWETMTVNVNSLTMLTRMLLPPMIARNEGKILNVASTAAFVPGPDMAVHQASQAYLLSFSRALSAELATSGVTVTCLCPGPTVGAFSPTAKPEGTLLTRGSLMPAEQVARAGYQAMMLGKEVEIPGGTNRMIAALSKLLPARYTTRFGVQGVVGAEEPESDR